MAASASAAIPAHSYTPEQLAKESRYLARIGNLMGTDHRTLSTYAKIKLWEDGPNYQKVVKYVNNSQSHPNVRLTVVNIHRVWRRGDPLDFFQVPNRMLLWHGTKRNNIPKILNTGFVLPPLKLQMFGAGIYFADRITKSTNYTDMDRTFLLLCEVSLGKQYSCKQAHNTWTSPPAGFDSVKANGTYVPDWTDFDHYMGSKIPSGKTALCTKYPSHAVQYNEFIVYDPSRIIIRFLVEVTVERLSPFVPITLVVPKDTRMDEERGGRRGRQRGRGRVRGRSSGQQRSSQGYGTFNNTRSNSPVLVPRPVLSQTYNPSASTAQQQHVPQTYKPMTTQQQNVPQVYKPMTTQQQNVPQVYKPMTTQQPSVTQVNKPIATPRVVQPQPSNPPRTQFQYPNNYSTSIMNNHNSSAWPGSAQNHYQSSQPSRRTSVHRSSVNAQKSFCCPCSIL